MFKKGWEMPPISPLLGIQNTHEQSHGCEEASSKENLVSYARPSGSQICFTAESCFYTSPIDVLQNKCFPEPTMGHITVSFS